MRIIFILPVALLLYGAVLLALLGATPYQGLPNPAIFQGTATVDEQPAPEGTLIVACVANQECAPGHPNPALARAGDTVNAEGRFIALTAQGTDHSQIGTATVYFFLINEHGRVQAEETATYGSSDLTQLFFQQDLTFGAAPTPAPTPTPYPYPHPGDPRAHSSYTRAHAGADPSPHATPDAHSPACCRDTVAYPRRAHRAPTRPRHPLRRDRPPHHRRRRPPLRPPSPVLSPSKGLS